MFMLAGGPELDSKEPFHMRKFSVLLLTLLVRGGCGEADQPHEFEVAITAEDFGNHVKTLASDEFEGRLPASEGEKKTLEYLTAQYERIGLQPMVGDSYLQPVPLVGITAKPDAALTISDGSESITLVYRDEMVIGTKRVVTNSNIADSELVFVGYGVVAPEYDWNDYAGFDMAGKTAVILVNDPGFASGDENLFRGRTMTYYGRWTYKYEEAARQGAAGAIIIHETEAAGYGWDVVSNGWSGTQFHLSTTDGNAGFVPIEGWITGETAAAVMALAGQDLASLVGVAAQRGFSPLPLGITASANVDNDLMESDSYNVAGWLPGSERTDEYLVYMAHWDHLGRDGDQIFNGAMDNATGTAALRELAERFAGAQPPPERSIIFLALTAEEQGLLGSAYYVANPIFPLSQTVAGFNIDRMSTFGPMRDVTVIGYGSSELEFYLEGAAANQDRVVAPEPTPEKGYFYRSDHFNFAKQGVPVLYIRGGIDHREQGPEYGARQHAEYVANRYHKPLDEYDPDWDLRGTVEDVELVFAVGRKLASESVFPNWYLGNEFRAIRDGSRAR